MANNAICQYNGETIHLVNGLDFSDSEIMGMFNLMTTILSYGDDDASCEIRYRIAREIADSRTERKFEILSRLGN